MEFKLKIKKESQSKNAENNNHKMTLKIIFKILQPKITTKTNNQKISQNNIA